MGLLWTALAVLVALGWAAHRQRRKTEPRALSDDMARQIEARGWVEVDEPLDLEEAREAEEEFWEEEWDEPEHW